MKAAVGNHQILSIMAVRSRPKPAGRDWPLYGDEYSRMKFVNKPSADHQNCKNQPLKYAKVDRHRSRALNRKQRWSVINAKIDNTGGTCKTRIRKVSNGIISTVAGYSIGYFSGDGGAATAANLDYPTNIAVDAAGDLYIAAEGNERISEISASTLDNDFIGKNRLISEDSGMDFKSQAIFHQKNIQYVRVLLGVYVY
jgi:hypothetical protein